MAKLYAKHIFPHYGIPHKVISDRDPRFTANFTRELCKLLGITQNISSAYHPQTDGQSERANQSIEQYLRLVVNEQQTDWAAWLAMAQYTHNSWKNRTTKQTPFEIIMGHNPTAHHRMKNCKVPALDNWQSLIEEIRRSTQEAIKKTQERNPSTKFKPFAKGDKVWLEGRNITRQGGSRKLSPRRLGPFEITQVISPVVYRLKLPPQWRLHDVFHAALLTPYKETVEHGPNHTEPPPDIIEGEPEWEVQAILDARRYRRKLQYKIRWQGYSSAHDSWEDASDV